jgi:hypothetical protein
MVMMRRTHRITIATAIAIMAVPTFAPPAQAAARDTDGDGMPNWWERRHGLDWRKANAGGDPDRDGVSNIKEFRLDQNPRRADAAQTCSAIEIALGATDPSQCGSTSVTQLLR